MHVSLWVFAPLSQCLPLRVFVEDFLTPKMSSATFRPTQSHRKSGTGWLLPLRGKWGWWRRNPRKNPSFEASSTLFRLAFLWKGKRRGKRIQRGSKRVWYIEIPRAHPTPSPEDTYRPKSNWSGQFALVTHTATTKAPCLDVFSFF